MCVCVHINITPRQLLMLLNFRRNMLIGTRGKFIFSFLQCSQSISWEIAQIMLTNERQVLAINEVEKTHPLINFK